MKNPRPESSSDPFNLTRFVEAQEGSYARAAAELRAGRKRSHWMWYIFPQFRGLGYSAMSKRYAIGSLEEARAYLAHVLLGPRLVEITEIASALEGTSAHALFGSPDDLKFHSCITLFAAVSPPDSPFHTALAKYFAGQPDAKTLELVGMSR